MKQAKREQLKKEGKLLTKKQKEENQRAEIRRQALLASGVQIEGLQQTSASAPAGPKKVVYGNRKKKGPTTKGASPAPESRPRSPEPTPTPPPEPKAVEKESKAEDVSDWEASSDEEPEVKPAAEVADVKSDWDASSDEEEKPTPAPAAAKRTSLTQCSQGSQIANWAFISYPIYLKSCCGTQCEGCCSQIQGCACESSTGEKACSKGRRIIRGVIVQLGLRERFRRFGRLRLGLGFRLGLILL